MRRPSRPSGATPPLTAKPARHKTVKRLLTGALSVGGHLAVFLALIAAYGSPPTPTAPEPMVVELIPPPPPPQLTPPPEPVPTETPPADPSPAPPAPAAATKPSHAKPSPARLIARVVQAPPDVAPLPAGSGDPSDEGDQVSEAQLASAARAGSGAPGRPCDMTRRLQAALRKDSRVQAAVAEADRAAGVAGKAHLVWNGDWIRSHGQEGNGLAAVREAIMWEVAFAPGACRAEPVHGLILITLNDGPGSSRLVVGSGHWQWSDLLGRRGVRAGESFR